MNCRKFEVLMWEWESCHWSCCLLLSHHSAPLFLSLLLRSDSCLRFVYCSIHHAWSLPHFLVFSYFWNTERDLKTHLSVLLLTDINVESGSWVDRFCKKAKIWEKKALVNSELISVQALPSIEDEVFQQSNQARAENVFTSKTLDKQTYEKKQPGRFIYLLLKGRLYKSIFSPPRNAETLFSCYSHFKESKSKLMLGLLLSQTFKLKITQNF